MAGAAMDHMLSLIIFMVAILIFIGLFTQNMQTGMAYQRHNAMSTKTSDLLDTLLLSPGSPVNWGQSDSTIVGVGLLDYTLFKPSSYSPMRLACLNQPPAYYSTSGAYYNNLTTGFGGYLFTPTSTTLSYANASKLFGVNGTYGFQLSLTPTVAFSIQKTSLGSPLSFLITVAGTGYPLANTPLVCSLLLVNQDQNQYPSYTKMSSSTFTDSAGMAEVTFPAVDGENRAYALVVYAYLDGLKGVGYYVNVPDSFTKTVVPLVDSFQNRTLTLVHGDSMGEEPSSYSQLTYNASFVIRTEEFTFRPVTLNQPNATGTLVYGSPTEPDNTSIEVPENEGVLIVTYKGSGPVRDCFDAVGFWLTWFTLTFGGNPRGHDWVATDIRQVTIGGIAYQAQLDLWSLNGGA